MSTDLNPFTINKTIRQLFSYASIGVITNLAGYGLYLLLASFWGAPKLAMTVLYSLGAAISFIANRRFTFHHDGRIGLAGARFLIAHVLGYLLNLLLLVLFVDWLGFAHQLVQAIAIIVVATFLFILFRVFVFAQQPPPNEVLRP